MENGPIFEWIQGNIVLDEHVDEAFFDKMINDLQHHHNDDEDSDYVPDDSDEYENIIGSWEAEYAAIDEEEVIIVTDDAIDEEGDTSDH